MPERASPLLTLTRKLLSRRIPSLSSLLAQLSEAEGYAEFIELVKIYLPERERDILSQPAPSTQVARFASYFEDRFFPLDDRFKIGDIESYSDITYRIPVVVMGLSYDDYHDMEWRPGALLMNFLIQSPYVGDEDIHVSMSEACVEQVPEELVERANKVRLTLEDARRLLKRTKYKPLVMYAEWLHMATGNFFLDTDYEMLWNSMPPEWSPENVKELTKQWKQAELHENETGDLIEWLEVDLPGRFEELVSFIEEKKAKYDKETEG